MISHLVDFEDHGWAWSEGPYKVGFWHDWSNDGAASLTLTLRSNHSKVLLALITAFVLLVGGYTWDIVCFIAHQTLSTNEKHDGLYHQRQAVLRNSRPPSSTLWNLLKLGWFWRLHAKHPWRRQLPFIFINVLHILGFIIAAIASVQVAFSGHNVLIKPRKCGVFPVDLADMSSNITFQSRRTANIRESVRRSMEYVTSCYNEDEAEEKPECEQDCKLFATPRLPFHLDPDVACPFPLQSLCRNSTAGTIRVYSEPLNSHDHFGINAQKRDRIDITKAAVCSPLPFTEDPDYVERRPIDPSATFPAGYANITLKYTSPPIKATVNELRGGYAGDQPYYITAIPSFPGQPVPDHNGNSSRLIDELRMINADVILGVLSNEAIYLHPSDDILFGTRSFLDKEACKCNNLPPGLNGSYRAQAISPFICIEQMQICNPVNDRCTPFDAFNNLLNLTTSASPRFSLNQDIGLTARQNATVSLIASSTNNANFATLFQSMGGSSLLASDLILESEGTMSLGTAPDQWRREIKHWFQIQLASMQRAFVERLHPPEDLDSHFLETEDPLAQELCGAQVVHQAEYTSCSVLGLVLILVLGSMLIVTALVLEPLVRWWRGKSGHGGNKQVEWEEGELLHMHRTAFEALGQGSWNTGRALVPTTEFDEMMAFPVASDIPDSSRAKLLGVRPTEIHLIEPHS